MVAQELRCRGSGILKTCMKGRECFGKTSFVGFKCTVEQLGVEKNQNTALCGAKIWHSHRRGHEKENLL